MGKRKSRREDNEAGAKKRARPGAAPRGAKPGKDSALAEGAKAVETGGEGIKPSKKLRKLFAGLVFCVSAKGDEEAEAEARASAAEGQQAQLTYGQIRELVTSHGGQVCGILHKRVYALIATERAAARRTQRVRKALKLDKPIIRAEYLEACRAAGERLPVDEYTVEVAPEAPRDESARRFDAAEVQEKNDAAPVVTVDLGCCCSCHDSGKPSCEWCDSHH